MVTYATPIDTITIVKDICALKQICTQSGGLRPFGVSIIVAGIDTDGPKVYETDPTGIYFRYRATVIGEGETEIEDIFDKEFKDTMTIEESLKLALKAMNQILDKNLHVDRIDASYIKTSEKKLTQISSDAIEKVLKEVRKNVKP